MLHRCLQRLSGSGLCLNSSPHLFFDASRPLSQHFTGVPMAPPPPPLLAARGHSNWGRMEECHDKSDPKKH
ncbi:hypothetical protein RHGRI_028712 [Rhododendron griersonianum]|uniref:Uncharacterized protein n=1 Tax=Rhododendron griersonianum TaxID=479676 RepID=A0AAV6IGW6_9ERIC|nr:hypothetical protein RHGRI_028712 [Rhododendron griersonianum]